MALLKITVLAHDPHDALAQVDYTLDGLSLGTEWVSELGLIGLTGDVTPAAELVGRVFERQVD